jgi:beta-lactamase superfamily II metal-dependent hydrolase
MFNVGDGDAILIHLSKGSKDLVMVVDCGRTGDYAAHMKEPLAALLEETGKEGPDIVVATHYDADHIAGLIPLMREYRGKVGQLWAHSPPESFDTLREVLEKNRAHETLLFDEHRALNEAEQLFSGSNVQRPLINEKLTMMLESLPQLRVLEQLHPDGARQIFHGHPIPGWPEIKILGPTEDYYNELFPATMSFAELITEEAQEAAVLAGPKMLEQKRRIQELAGLAPSGNPCDRVAEDGAPSITATNRASLIFAIDVEDRRYLFTGDAGIQSFKTVPDWQNELKDLHWLKVPHHGSERNLTREVINVMRPKYADCSGGDQHLDQHVLDCIGRNARNVSVRSTLSEGGALTMDIN